MESLSPGSETRGNQPKSVTFNNDYFERFY